MDAQLKWRLWQTVAMVACCCVLVACSEDGEMKVIDNLPV
jgi:hypothetical protein